MYKKHIKKSIFSKIPHFKLLIVFFLLAVILVLIFGSNKAKSAGNNIVKDLSILRPYKICELGDLGFGPDNSHPWYQGHILVNEDPALEAIVKTAAKNAGYELTAKKHTFVGAGSESLNNPDNRFLYSGDSYEGLRIDIIKEGDMNSYCSNKKAAIPKGTDLLIIHLILPSRLN